MIYKKKKKKKKITGRTREEQGGQICPLLQRQYYSANTRVSGRSRTLNPVLHSDKFENREIGRSQKRNIWRAPQDSGNPLPEKFCHMVYPATSEELTVKLAGHNIATKYFLLQLEYRGKRNIQVIICNVPVQLNRDVLAAYLSNACESGR